MASGEAVWLRFSGFHVAQLTARRGRGKFAGWHATASSFTKQGIARGRDEQRCFRRVQNYFGVLREKELFDRLFFFFPQASPAEHLQVNGVDQFAIPRCFKSGKMWESNGRINAVSYTHLTLPTIYSV